MAYRIERQVTQVIEGNEGSFMDLREYAEKHPRAILRVKAEDGAEFVMLGEDLKRLIESERAYSHSLWDKDRR